MLHIYTHMHAFVCLFVTSLVFWKEGEEIKHSELNCSVQFP